MNIHKKTGTVLSIALILIALSILVIPGLRFSRGNIKQVNDDSGVMLDGKIFVDTYINQSKITLAAPVNKPDGNDKGQEKETKNQNSQGSQEKKDDKAEQPNSPEKRGDADRKDDYDTNVSWIGEQYVLGFYVDKEYSHPSSYNRMVSNGKSISAVAPFWYRLSPDNGSKLQEHHPYEGFTADDLKAVIGKAHEQDIEVLMLVHNLLYRGQADGKQLASQMLATGESRKTFVDEVERLLKEFDYDGINMDIENIYLEDRDKFSQLIKELYERLSPQGYKITVCVPAKTGDNRSNTWSGPFDYKKIGQYSDYVAIMTYDEHGYSSGPGPVASYGWVWDVMRYATGKIPSRKILMGISGYGFDWTVGQRGPRYLSYSQAIDLAASKGAKILWDNSAKAPYFKYRDGSGKTHKVWFESKYSLNHKLNIAKEFNIGGIALWRIGLEDAGMWDVIGKRIKAVK